MLPRRVTAAPLGPCRNVWRPQLLGSFLSAQRHLARCRRKLETVIFCCLFFVGETIQRLIAENLHCTADTTNHAVKIRNTLLPHHSSFLLLLTESQTSGQAPRSPPAAQLPPRQDPAKDTPETAPVLCIHSSAHMQCFMIYLFCVQKLY